MKYFLLSIITSIIFMHGAYTQSWRLGEKQVLITLESSSQAAVIEAMKISFDRIAENQIRAYVVPKELSHLASQGISWDVEIEDLNKQETALFSEEAFHSYQEIIDLADSLVQEFPSICEKHIFAESMGGRQLAALKISDNVDVDEPEAEILFDGGIHGDEILGPEIIIRFARDICIAYGSDPEITELIDNREIWLYLMVNPDGRESVPRTRYNNNGVDLNRDAGYMWDAWGGSTGPFSQVESKSLRDCMYTNQFVVHTTYHAGTEYISLPWSYRSSQPADWNHILQLGGLYSSSSLYSNLTYGQGNTGMYAINGSTKDSNYGIMGSITWSMEISYDKQPPPSQLIPYYNRNYPAMLTMVEYAGYGLEGIVTDAVTGDPVEAVVFVEDFFPTFTDATAGDYHKYVLPGTYSITVTANGYEPQTIEDIEVFANSASATNFELTPSEGHYVYRFTTSQIPDNNEADEGLTTAVIGAPDEVRYSIGKNGWAVLDMQFPVLDGPGMDLMVYENDATPETFELFASESMDGPWISLGNGTGNSEFDLANASLAEAQFIKIQDDGDGSAVVNDAGFDLDAIEALEQVSGVYIAMYDVMIDDSQGNNNGRIDAGETVNIIVSLKNNGDVTAGNTSGTVSTVSPYVSIDVAVADFGTLLQGQSAEGVFTLTTNDGTPMGEPFALDLEVTANGGGYNNTYGMSFSIGLIVEDWESGNFEQYDWETGGDNNWTISTQSPYEGIYCVKSGPIGDESSTYLSISYDVLASGEIGFYKKVSSEDNYDFLLFYIDNTLIDQWSGDVPWSESTYPVTAGPHTFMWVYEKDYSVSGGSDCAWLDFISLPSGASSALAASFAADQTGICEGTTVTFTDGSSGNVIEWEWAFEGGTPATSTFQNPTVAYFENGSYDVTLTVSDGANINTVTLENFIEVDYTPEVPETPTGEEEVCINFVWETDYSTAGSTNAESYSWDLEPAEAGTISGNGMTGEVQWNISYIGLAYVKVQGVNNCGEGAFSEALEVIVDICGGIDENTDDDILVIPNPSSGSVSLQIKQGNMPYQSVQILDQLGRTVYLQEAPEKDVHGRIQLTLEDLEKGVYLVVVKGMDNRVIKKLIIQ